VAGRRLALCTTWDVMSETVALLRYRRGFVDALAFLTDVRPHLRVVSYGERVRAEAEEIFRRFERDRRLSLCDAVSFVVVTTLLERCPCLAFDEDFRALGLTVLH
jgi:predicted nucleic acid-binding protein